jgi:hypothetical protein
MCNRSNKVVWPPPTGALPTPLPAHTEKRVFSRCGEVTPPTSFGTSPRRHSTSPSVRSYISPPSSFTNIEYRTFQRTTSSHCLASKNPKVTGSGSVETSPQVVLLVLRHCFSSIPWTMLVLVWLMMPSRPKAGELVSSMGSLMSTERLSLQTASLVCTVALFLRSSVSLSIVVSTLVYTIPLVC